MPEFKNEDEEFEFWSSHDTTDYVDWANVVRVDFPNLNPTPDIDLRLQELLVMRDVERIAVKNHITKRALIVQYLTDAVQRERAVANG